MIELGYMGKYARDYRPGFANLHRLTNDVFGLPSVQAFPPAAVVIQQKKIPDVSFWQGVIDFVKMRAQTDALIIRAGQNTWVDTQFARNWLQARQNGILRGAYWFYDDRVSPGKQAEIFAGLLRDDLPEMEVWCDWENTYGGAYGGLANVVAFMQRVEQLLPGVKIGLYTGYYWFRDRSNAVTNASQYTYLKSRPLFEAWYTNNAANVLVPNPWTSIFLWQFGTPAVGGLYGVGSTEIDMSFINMTEAQFQEKYHGVTPPPIGGSVEDKYFKVTASALNIRSATVVDPLNDIGDLVKDDIVHAIEVVAANGVTWHQIDPKVFRLGMWANLSVASPTGKLYAAEKGSAVWMVEVPNPTPPTSTEYILHVKDGVTRKFVPG